MRNPSLSGLSLSLPLLSISCAHISHPLCSYIGKSKHQGVRQAFDPAVILGKRRLSCHLGPKETFRRHSCFWVEVSLGEKNCHCPQMLSPEESPSGGGCLNWKSFPTQGSGRESCIDAMNAALPARCPSL